MALVLASGTWHLCCAGTSTSLIHEAWSLVSRWARSAWEDLCSTKLGLLCSIQMGCLPTQQQDCILNQCLQTSMPACANSLSFTSLTASPFMYICGVVLSFACLGGNFALAPVE